MNIIEKNKHFFTKNKKYILVSGTVVLSIVGVGVGYVVYKNNKISFSDWLKLASKEELEKIYKKMRLNFCETGTKEFGMEQISYELGVRGAKEWFMKHPPNTDPNFRWTDANRWDID